MLLDDGLVQRPADVTAGDLDLDHQTLVELPVIAFRAVEERRQGGLQLVGLDLGEIAEAPQVDPQERGRCAIEQMHAAQHRAVATEAEHEIGRAECAIAGELGGTGLFGVRGRRPELDVVALAPPRHRHQLLADRHLGMGESGKCPHEGVSAWTRNSVFPSAPVIGEVVHP